MKDMIKKIREDREGFTLAELLIVVAIIAVLVAIAIPVFNVQLEKSREATDAANLRAAYAEVMTAALTESDDVEGVTKVGAAGSYTYTAEVEASQVQDDWQNDSIENIGGVAIAEVPAVTTGKSWTVTYTQADGKVTFAEKA